MHPSKRVLVGMHVSNAIATIRELDRNDLEQFLNAMELLRGTASSPDLEALNEEMITRTRLALRWRNQVGEQTLSTQETTPMVLRGMADLIEKTGKGGA